MGSIKEIVFESDSPLVLARFWMQLLDGYKLGELQRRHKSAAGLWGLLAPARCWSLKKGPVGGRNKLMCLALS